ncbi:MAG: hypothetical protein LLG20_10355 [Acidobacteriales bacterium]|nr:hypothetical protein [Terriglobales bacterium]
MPHYELQLHTAHRVALSAAFVASITVGAVPTLQSEISFDYAKERFQQVHADCGIASGLRKNPGLTSANTGQAKRFQHRRKTCGCLG